MAIRGVGSFATFLIVGRESHPSRNPLTHMRSQLTPLPATCFFLGILFANFPYDYYVLWSIPETLASDPTADPRMPYFALLESHLKFLFNSPPLISRMLHIVVGVGLLGFVIKLYKANEANLLFDGASLVLYMCGVVVYIANIVKGMRTVDAGAYGGSAGTEGEGFVDTQAQDEDQPDFIGREDSLRVMAASNTILALVLVGVLVLQAGQWYAQRKEAEELEQMDKARDDKKKGKEASGSGGSKKKQ